MSDITQVALRLPPELAKKIDERVRVTGAPSRNEWLVRALRWAVEQPVTNRPRTEKV